MTPISNGSLGVACWVKDRKKTNIIRVETFPLMKLVLIIVLLGDHFYPLPVQKKRQLAAI
jgi:hypothetical protein